MITEIFIRRPILTIVLTLIILLVGLLAYFNLPTRLYPKVDTAVISVLVNYSGADAELMENYITAPIENALASVTGADYITSESRAGLSYINLHLKMGDSINEALNEANNKISSIRGGLPPAMDNPIVTKYDSAARPIMFLNFTSNTWQTTQIVDYLLRVIQPQLQTIPGVADDNIFGSGFAMRIWLDPYLMAAYDVTPADIRNAFAVNNSQTTGGRLDSAWQLVNVKTITELNKAQQFNDMVINNSNGGLVYLKNIGKAEIGPKNTDTSIYTNGKRSVVVGIIPTTTANYLSIAKDIKILFPRLMQNLPGVMSASIFWDSTKFIYASIREVKKTIIEAALWVVLIIFLFIGSWRVLLIPTVIIPLSLLGVCALMYLMHFSLNTMTFLAFVLAIGMVVDDAIVVSENIHRHVVNGKGLIDAAIVGSREIQFAIISITLILAVVYLPIAFLNGLIGALFKEFAFTLAGAVVISGLFALMLSPMMCSRIMTKSVSENRLTQNIYQITEKMIRIYHLLLLKVLQKGRLILLVLPLIIGACLLLYYHIPSELAPKEDVGSIVTMINGPTSSNIKYIEKYTKLLEPIYKSIPEVQNRIMVNGDGGNSSMAFSLLDLKPWSERKRTSDQIIKAISPKLAALPGVIAQAINPSSLPGADTWGGVVDIELQTTGSYLQLHNDLQKLLQAASSNPGLTNLNISLKLDQLQDNVIINHHKAADMGISAQEIGNAINLAIGESTIGHFSMSGRSYDIISQVQPKFRNSTNVIKILQVRTKKGELVPLSNLVKIKETIQPQSLNHFQQMRSASITANVAPGYTLGQALQFFNKISKKILPEDTQIDYGGESRLYLQSGSQMRTLFIFSLILVFLILAAQFESLYDPLVILFALPFSIFGALLVMFLTGCTMNIYSEIGLLTLIGLISKHGILMVDFANQLRLQGKNKQDSIMLAAAIRLRPILMTTATVVLGAIPLVVSHGAGAVSRQQIGWIIMGGMSIGTLFTLFVVPTMYMSLAAKEKIGVSSC